MDRGTAQDWLDRYVAAWKSYDSAAIGELFSDDVTYRYHPYDEPIVGRSAVVESWLGEASSPGASGRDEPGTFDASYSPVAVDGDLVVATGSSDYFEAPGGELENRFHNCFVIRFDQSGRCQEFTEYYMRKP